MPEYLFQKKYLYITNEPHFAMKRFLQLLAAVFCVVFFVFANKQEGISYNGTGERVIPANLEAEVIPIPDGCDYTAYQILVWEIKANEGYRSWWYRDGVGGNGRPAYSIGFGWNDCGGVRRHEIKKYTADHKVTVEEATEIMLAEIAKYGKMSNDPLRDVAMKLHRYNCGTTVTGQDLRNCCGGSSGCGRNSSSIRNSHNRRRKFELALWMHDLSEINRITSENKEKVSNMIHQSS